MICPNCQHDNSAAVKFCPECGTRLHAVCPQCGTELPPAAKFCPECGTRLAASPPSSQPSSLEEQLATLQKTLPTPVRDHLLAQPEGENRLVTVLFADMSRSLQTTAHLAPDEAAELVSTLLKAMVDALLKYEGRVDRFLGDGVLAVFGTPQARESDPECAVRAALEIRDAARQLHLEVTAGINTGEVYVGEIGSDRHREITVMGPVVNLASRLQGQAEPGQILVGETTYRQTRRAFAFTPLSLTIKGIAQSVPAYAVERLLPRPEKVRGIEGLHAELIGRDDELARLKKALEEAQRGRGHMVSLIGEAGVGKSRLVAELRQIVGCRVWGVGGDGSDPPPHTLHPTALWLEGRCLEMSASASYWLFVDLFRHYFALAPEAEEQTRAERLVTALQAMVDQGDLAAERMDEIGPLLGHMLSLRCGTEWDERLKNAAPEQIRHQTFLAIRDLLLALSRRQPLMLVCEDLHWADSLSLDVVSFLMETLTLAPILLLCTYRPERESTRSAGTRCWHLGTIAARKCADRYTEISLRELSPSQSRRLVEALLTIDQLPASVNELILEKSRGNPFFVEEVVRSLIASGMVYRERDEWRAREGIESITVPESIQSVILSRVDRLEPELRRVLESAAVIGRLFRRRLLEKVVTSDESRVTSGDDRSSSLVTRHSSLAAALWELEEQALIYQERVTPEEEYSFKHVLTQETIYQGILRRRRFRFHQQVAEAIEALYSEGLEEFYEQLASHYERSDADEKTVEYLLKAGEKARRAYLNEAAAGYFQRALERLDSGVESSADRSFNAERVERLVKAGPPDLSALHPPLSTRQRRLAALRGLGQVQYGIGQIAEAERLFRQAIALGREIGLPVPEMIQLYHLLGDLKYWQNRWEEQIQLGEEGLALVGDQTESLEAALMNALTGWAYYQQGDWQRAGEYIFRNAEFVARLRYTEELRPAYIYVVLAYLLFKKDPEKALHWAEAFRRAAEEHHDLRALGNVYLDVLPIIRDFQGDVWGALADRRRGLALFRQIGDAKHEAICQLRMGGDHLTLGELAAAQEAYQRGLDHFEAVGSWGYADWARRDLATIALCEGQADRAIDLFRRVIQLWKEGKTSPTVAARRVLGRALLLQGERDEAAQQFEQAIDRLVKGGRPDGTWLSRLLSDLEAAWGDSERFRSFCEWLRAECPGPGALPRVLWLAPAKPGLFPPPRFMDDFTGELAPGWAWQDPLGDGSYRIGSGLEIHAANARDLRDVNLSAPRLVRSAEGQFAVQTVCAAASAGKPGIGGLLLWKDSKHYLRLDRGARGPAEVSFQGCWKNEDMLFGRGWLTGERVYLRLERRAGRVRALCSADGAEWFAVGEAEFSVEDPVEVGLHAIGQIDRAIYPGAYPEGTAIRFESFHW